MWIIVLYVGHLFIDQFRTFVFTDNTKGKGLLLLTLDQLAHILLIGAIAWAATGWVPADLAWLFTDSLPSEYRLMAYLCGVAIMIGVVPVLEAEITVAAWAAQGHEVNRTVEIASSDRILGSLERITAMTLILTGYGLLAPVIFLPRLALMIYQGQAKANRTAVATKVITSFVTAVIISILLHRVPAPLLIIL